MTQYLQILGIVLLLLSYACQSPPTRTSLEEEKGLIHDGMHIQHAIGFNLKAGPDYQLLELFRHFASRVDTVRYVLHTASVTVPKQWGDLIHIQIPIKKSIVLSSTHLGMIHALQQDSIVRAISTKNYIWNPGIRKRVADGDILEVGTDAGLDVERIILLQPDLILASAYADGLSPALEQLLALGIPVLPLAEWQETSMLGRAEWIKLIGALTQQEARATTRFDSAAYAYEQLRKKVEMNTQEKPRILIGIPFKGVWSVPGGDSYMGKLLVDAGADYPWRNARQTGGLHLDFEAIYPEGMRAAIWLNPGVFTDMQALLSQEHPFTDFPSVQKGDVYHNYKRANPEGGNDYWESGLVQPHIVLADLVSILHPQLLPNHQRMYFDRLQAAPLDLKRTESARDSQN